MRAVIQRVTKAKVLVNNATVGQIGQGLVVFIGIKNSDSLETINLMCKKILNLRIFEDENSKFNLNLLDIKGEILIVSQFTLYADCRHGRRPSFSDAAPIDKAREFYDIFIKTLKEQSCGLKVETGIFQAKMLVELENDGPVTIILDSEDL